MSEHGTRSRYVGGCRCIECRAANARYAAELERRRAREAFGAPTRMVDAAPVRERLLCLYAQGYSEREVSELSGVSRTVLRSITHAHQRTRRPVRRCQRKTKDAVFSINGPRLLRGRQLVDASFAAACARRWLEAGVPTEAIAREVGCSRQAVDAWLASKAPRMRACTLHALLSARPALDRMADRAACQRAANEP